MSLSPGLLLFFPETVRATAEVLFQAQLSFRMCCLCWAPIPASADDKEPHGNCSCVAVNTESRAQMNAALTQRISQGSSKRGALVRGEPGFALKFASAAGA